jgi:predicted ArsR family transcriptional regulator
MKDCEIATELDVSTAQARQWLNQLVEEGIVKKKSRPIRYVVEEEADIFDSVRNE